MLTERPEASPNAPWNRRVSLLSLLASILLSGAPMRHLLALALLALALPSVGHAQLTVALVSIDGETMRPELIRGVNAAHCESNAELVFQIGTTMMPVLNVDVWHSNGTDADCTSTTDRSMDPAVRRCVNVGTVATNRGELRFNVADLAETASSMCESDRTPYTFLFVDSSTTVTGELPAGRFGSIEVIFDAQPPSPPTVTRTEVSGSGNVPIGWEPVGPDNSNQPMRYQVYRLDGGCGSTPDVDAGTDAGPMTMDAGIDADMDDAGMDDAGTDDAGMDDAGMDDAGMDDAGGGVGSGSAALTAQGSITTGNSASVPAPGAYVVRTVDFSNNESADSEIVCVTEVPTVGFCDIREGGCPDGCSAGSTRAGGTAAVLVFLGLVLARRRKLV